MLFFFQTHVPINQKNLSKKIGGFYIIPIQNLKNDPIYKMYYNDKKNSKNKLKALEVKI